MRPSEVRKRERRPSHAPGPAARGPLPATEERRTLRAALGALALAAFVAGSSAPAPAFSAEPAHPDHAIARAQRRIQRNPLDAAAYHRLGDAYIQKARASGDPTYFTLAQQTLRKSLEIAPRNASAWRHLAFVASSLHEFEEAAAHAAKAIGIDANDADAYGVLGDAHLELGRYDEAEAAYRQMIRLDRGLGSYGRLSGLKNLRGDTQGAIEDLKLAIQVGQANGDPKESVAWAQWQLASEYFGVGDLAAAEAAYTNAMTTYPNYYRALAGLAQVRAAQKRYAEAIDLYQKAIGVIPLPEYAAALGDVYTRLQKPAEAKKQYDLVEYIGRLNAITKVIYNREVATFYADHDIKLTEALDLARKELEYRRDIYAYDLLAWALHKNGTHQEALAAITEALKLGTKDAKLFFHAGMIHHRIGEPEKAKEYLRRALSTNPHFHILYAEVAERTLRNLERQPSPLGTQERRYGQ